MEELDREYGVIIDAQLKTFCAMIVSLVLTAAAVHWPWLVESAVYLINGVAVFVFAMTLKEAWSFRRKHTGWRQWRAEKLARHRQSQRRGNG